MTINTDAFMNTLSTVAIGMGGIFIVIGVIYLTIRLLMFFTKGKKSQ